MTDYAALEQRLREAADRSSNYFANETREAADAIAALSRDLEEARTRHSSQVAQLLIALEPFAMISEGDEGFPDDTKVVVTFGRSTHYALRLEDLRRAQHINNAVWEAIAADDGQAISSDNRDPEQKT